MGGRAAPHLRLGGASPKAKLLPVAPRFDRIRTARLVMRRWRASDRAPYAAMNADPAVMRYFPATLDRAASDAHADRI